MIVVLIFSGFRFFKPSAAKDATVAKGAIGIVLRLLAIFGTVMGTKLADGTIINVRELAAMVAGLGGWTHRRRDCKRYRRCSAVNCWRRNCFALYFVHNSDKVSLWFGFDENCGKSLLV
jgi:hypothetical protein